MFWRTRLRSSPSTTKFRSMYSRMRDISSSGRARTFLSPAAAHDLAVIAATFDRCRYLHGKKSLLEAIGDPTPSQVVRGELHQHTVSRQYANEIHPDLAGGVGKDTMPIRQFYTKHRVGQVLLDDPLNFYGLFFPHARPGPATARGLRRSPPLCDCLLHS